MKKAISILVAVLFVLGCLSACGSGTRPSASDSGKIQIVTTIFPEYDWVMNILGDKAADAEVAMLLDTGVDLHSFQPTAADILKISTCDLFIYVGGESDEWAEDALRETANPDRITLNLLDLLGDTAKEEEAVEGMQEEEHEHESEEDEAEYDEHVWLSLRCAADLAEKIAEAIREIDPENGEVYRQNAAAYAEKLHVLDAEYRSVVENASFKTLIFGDRFPFRYLADDYGLDYYAAFSGCSAETEASFETVTFLALKVDELALPAVMTIEGTDHRIAETIVQNTRSKDQAILTMDSMQSVTAKDVQNGAAYLSIMEKNLSVLKEALQ
ncbi:MAG: zinc ABC transporter substrate-binding protein [Clostridia bacterium]|nr:zinc ABC transporter substrate-binding protein [Clostridia bacterium]MBR5366452.1 zinc ABC transporter substrate-binding protein [Clostridia bacterium]